MIFYVLDDKFNTMYIVDEYKSALWVDRFNLCGDFEIYIPASKNAVNIFIPDWYLYSPESEYLMVIEGLDIESDSEDGDKMIIVGRSLESLLDRRSILSKTDIKGNLQDGIEKLLNDNIISPSNEKRKIDNFVFKKSDDERITSIEVDISYLGVTVYEAICDLCKNNKIGFKVMLTSDFKFEFSLYYGENRSYDQDKNPYVVFSNSFDNIMNSNYVSNKSTLKNVAHVVGQEIDGVSETVTVTPSEDEPIGLSRREIYVDAGDISKQEGDTTISDEEYTKLLTQRGKDTLEDNKETKSFEGQVETTRLFSYGRDFFMGDLVQFANEYGIQYKSRIVEYIRSYDSDGVEEYPTFEVEE